MYCAVTCPTLEIAYELADIFEKYRIKVYYDSVRIRWERFHEETAFSIDYDGNKTMGFCNAQWYKSEEDCQLYEYTNDIEATLLADGWLKESDKNEE